MINPKDFLSYLKNKNINFFSGVPDSLLKELLHLFEADDINHIITANEGLSVSLAAGYSLATGNIPLIYMQNSGLGNAINPIVSLLHKDVYDLPVLFLIGWRGRPGSNDEPQHMVQGRITLEILKLLNIDYHEISATSNYEDIIDLALKNIYKTRNSQAFIVHENTFFNTAALKREYFHKNYLSREYAIEKIIENFHNDIIISSTGKASRELFMIRKRRGETQKDFLTVGSMGHASSIALGIALNNSKRIICIDGDGALAMHMGALITIGYLKPINFVHIMINNQCHESVGGQPTCTNQVNYRRLTDSLGYKQYLVLNKKRDFESITKKIKKFPAFIEVIVNNRVLDNLPRPDKAPKENKLNFMKYLNSD